MPRVRPIITGMGLLFLWHLIVLVTGVEHFILPSPIDVATALISRFNIILGHTWITFIEILLGLTFGIILGTITAILIGYFVPARQWLMPVLVISQAVPVFALAPILVRTAPTECPLMTSVLLACTAYLIAFEASKYDTGYLPKNLLAAGFLGLAIQMHLVTLCWLLPWLTLPLCSPKRHQTRAWFILALTSLFIAPHAVYNTQSFLLSNERAINPATRFIEQLGEPAIILLNPFLLPFAILPLACMTLFRAPALIRGLSWFTLVPITLLSVSVSQNLSDVLRYQAPVAFCFLIPAAYGVQMLLSRISETKELYAHQIALTMIIAISALPSLPLAWAQDPESELTRVVEEAAGAGLLEQGLITPTPNADQISNRPTALPAWALPQDAPRTTETSSLVLLGTRCVHANTEKPPLDSPSLDPGCAIAVDTQPIPIRTIGELPREFAGMPVFFMPLRPNAPAPGIYRARKKPAQE